MFDLIWFRHGVSRLEVENLGDAVTGENVVTSFDPLGESQPGKEAAEFAEADVRIRGPLQHSQQNRFRHVLIMYSIARSVLPERAAGALIVLAGVALLGG